MAELPDLDEDIENIMEDCKTPIELSIDKVEDLEISTEEREIQESPFLKPKLKKAKKVKIKDEEELILDGEEVPLRLPKPRTEKQLAHIKKLNDNRKLKKEKADYKKRTKKPAPPIIEEAEEQLDFDPNPKLSNEELEKQLLEKDHKDFIKFMGNMEKYKTITKCIDTKPVNIPIKKEVQEPKKIPIAIQPQITNEYSYCFN